jgi:hypothetical protein
LIGVAWAVVPLAGITLMGKTHARRSGCICRLPLVGRAGTALSGSAAAISLISCVSGMACLLARCGDAFERVNNGRSEIFVRKESER